MYAWSYWIKYGVKKAGRTPEQHNFWSTPRVAGAHHTSLCSPLHSLPSSLAALGSLCARGGKQHQNLPARLWGRRAPQAEQMGRTHPLHPPPHPPNLGGNARHVLRLWRGATSKSAPPAAARFWGPAARSASGAGDRHQNPLRPATARFWGALHAPGGMSAPHVSLAPPCTPSRVRCHNWARSELGARSRIKTAHAAAAQFWGLLRATGTRGEERYQTGPVTILAPRAPQLSSSPGPKRVSMVREVPVQEVALWEW
ncbi:hypothetical protein C8F04DRAFT_1341775 [Mycena alexandri]|uniref:Uncharacterized protein n=1 Tax=Mycena alexandri TaxID=1745969 RepID=A0AAD6SXD4_9AGAR|nr:hypothetical protein C8F04DRAFT_1341775 [Mycena alexandri]